MRPARGSLAGESPAPTGTTGRPQALPALSPLKGRQARLGGLRPPLPGTVLVTGTRRRTGHLAGIPALPSPHRGPSYGAEGSGHPDPSQRQSRHLRAGRLPAPRGCSAEPGKGPVSERTGAAGQGLRERVFLQRRAAASGPQCVSLRLRLQRQSQTVSAGGPPRRGTPPRAPLWGPGLTTKDPEKTLPSHPAPHKESSGKILNPGSASRISLLCGFQKEPLLGLRLPSSQ